MIRINLLGKRKDSPVPFALDEKLEKLGINIGDFSELLQGLVRLGTVALGLYVANYVPTYLHEEKMKQLDEKYSKLAVRTAELQKEVSSKRDIRKQMEQLNKEEVDLQRQLNAVNALQRNRSSAFVTLNDLVVNLSKSRKLWINDLKYEGQKIFMNGHSWEYIPINDFVKDISESTRYTNVLFKEVAAEEAKRVVPGVPESAQKIKKFALEFTVREME